MSTSRRALAALVAALVLVSSTAWADPPHAARTTPAATSGTQATPAPSPGVVNLNTATEEELVRLPGIGPSRAAAILALRQRLQRFRTVDDLQRVRGIGRATLRRLRPMLSLTGETTLPPRAERARRRAGEEADPQG